LRSAAPKSVGKDFLLALWQIVLLGLVAEAGLPALFAVGLRALAPPAAAALLRQPTTRSSA
jgi:hypothetical protein